MAEHTKVSSLITTTDAVLPGQKIVTNLGIVIGTTVRAKHVGRDIMANLKSLVGGELRGYTELLSEGREQAIYRMQEAAFRKGANAVVMVRLNTAAIMVSAIEILAYGTAVIVEDI